MTIISMSGIGIAFQRFEYAYGGLMQFHMKRLYLFAQIKYFNIVGTRFAVKPLTENAGGVVGAAGKFGAVI